MSVQICPGCQGRNAPDTDICDWCGRPFREGGGPFILRWWHVATVAMLGMVVAAVAALFLVGAVRLDPRQQAAPLPPSGQPPAVAASPALPTRAATAPVAAAPTPISPPKPATAASPTPVPAAVAASPTPPPARYTRVFNTGGLGVYMRQEPGPQGERILPAIAEGTLLRLVGPEETVQAQVWRLCEHEGRNVQAWVPAQFLQPTDLTPTPGRQ